MRASVMCLASAGLALSACSESGVSRVAFVLNPVELQISEKTITLGSRETRLAYVLDQTSGSISVVDLDRRDYLDADRGDDEDNTPIVVGGAPNAMVIDDRFEHSRLYVSVPTTKTLWPFNIEASEVDGRLSIDAKTLDWGATDIGQGTQALFLDRGRLSSPSLEQLVVSPADPLAQWWTLTFKDGAFELEGSVSGKVATRAPLNGEFDSADLGLRFEIKDGADRSTQRDTFYLGVRRGRPLVLDCTPSQLHLVEANLFIVCEFEQRLKVVDVDSGAIASDLDISSGGLQLLGRTFIVNDELWIPKLLDPEVLTVNLETLTLGQRPVPFIIDQGIYLSEDDILVHEASERRWAKLLVSDLSVVSNLETQFLSTHASLFEKDSKKYLLAPSLEGPTEVIDLELFSLLDTDPPSGDEVESRAFDIEFVDVGAESSPSLVRVDTANELTRAERWQVIFQGERDGLEKAYALIGSVSGEQATLCEENSVCTSDNGEIRLSIRGSFSRPTTPGDYFTFITTSSVTPLTSGGGRQAGPIGTFTDPGGSTPLAAVAFADGSGIRFYRLDTWRDVKNLR